MQLLQRGNYRHYLCLDSASQWLMLPENSGECKVNITWSSTACLWLLAYIVKILCANSGVYTTKSWNLKSSLLKISNPFHTWRLLQRTTYLPSPCPSCVLCLKSENSSNHVIMIFFLWGNEHQLTGGWKAYEARFRVFFEESVRKISERRRKLVSGYSVELCSIHTLTLQIHLYSNDCESQVDHTQEAVCSHN